MKTRPLTTRILELERALGLSIGAMKMVKQCPHDFNFEGLTKILAELESIAQRPWIELDDEQVE